MNGEDVKKLGKRIPLIGRQDELQQLNEYLYAPGAGRNYVYYWARGGLGKTRLLEELDKMVKAAGPRFYFSGIIDLFHTDTHSTSDLERIIVEGLDPDQHFFVDYREARKTYALLRERGTDPSILEDRRRKLGDLFVQGCRDMALRADKLVICFDTIELLQYESSIVEEKAGLDIADTRVKPWLLEKLAQLSNVLVVFVGRPKYPAPGEQADPQARLVADMQEAFGKDLTVVELKPFSLEETREFLRFFEAAAKQELIPSEYVKIVHRLTGGRPIFLHLIVDWFAVFALESRTIMQVFERYMDLVDVDADDKRLEAARQDIERGILNALFNYSGEIGGYLHDIALMPKGVDADVLNVALGLPLEEANRLLTSLEPLSFIKHYKSPPGVAPVHGEQLFLHDEIYRLLTSRDVIPYLRKNERRVANTLVRDYYNPRIAALERQLPQSTPEQRLSLREQLQKLQVERVYYLLVVNPRWGYEAYKNLTSIANQHRQVGFAMRLLDEFLRFYNSTAPERRRLFEEVGIINEQIVRESAWMWVERFDYWGQDTRVIQLAERILESPGDFSILCSEEATNCSEEDLILVGNVYAFWTGARARLNGYEPQIVVKAQGMLSRLPTVKACSAAQALARARMATAVGYQYRLGGMLNRASMHYVDAKAAFRKLGDQLRDHEDEYALLLNSLAFVYAKQGRMALARPLAHEALRRNEERESDYHTGMTLSTLSQIARMRGNYSQAVKYGEEALTLFQELGDVRGTVLSHQGIAQAKRRMAKHNFEKGREKDLETSHQTYIESRDALVKALSEATSARIGSIIPDLQAELGRVYRELGNLIRRIEGFEQSVEYYHKAQDYLNVALKSEKWSDTDRASALQDLAEVYYALKNQDGVQMSLARVETSVGLDYQIIPGERIPAEGLARQHFEALGKIEMLRGQMAFQQGVLDEGVKHYVLAYAYFRHFSSDVDMDTMVEYLYNHLGGNPVVQQRAVLEQTRKWTERYDFGVDIQPFVRTLEDLFGF